MSDHDMRELCKRVLALPPACSFRAACQFIADCGDIDFVTVVKVCQPVAAEMRK